MDEAPDRPPRLRVTGLHKAFAAPVLRGIALDVRAGEVHALIGANGAGKSTLAKIIAGLLRPDAGTMERDGEPYAPAGRRAAGAAGVQIVHQELNLLPTLTALENVTLPLRLAGRKVDRRHAADLLARVGLGDRVHHRPGALSGGQQQRVAIARALAARPALIFADEPTGALDTRAARDVLGLLRQAVHEYGQTVVMVTHDPGAASWTDRVVFLADGHVVDEIREPTPERVLERMAALDHPVGA